MTPTDDEIRALLEAEKAGVAEVSSGSRSRVAWLRYVDKLLFTARPLAEEVLRLRSRLADAERDAARWRAIEPHMECGKMGESTFLSMVDLLHYRGEFTLDTFMDRLVAEKEGE